MSDHQLKMQRTILQKQKETSFNSENYGDIVKQIYDIDIEQDSRNIPELERYSQ